MISAFSVLFFGLSAVSFIGGFVSSAEVSRDKRLYSSVKALWRRKTENINEHAAHAYASQQRGIVGLAHKNDIHLSD